MKIMIFNKTYDCRILPSMSCRMCIMRDSDCSKVSPSFCIRYGGFRLSNTKIFTL